jgi:hypothetical protein
MTGASSSIQPVPLSRPSCRDLSPSLHIGLDLSCPDQVENETDGYVSDADVAILKAQIASLPMNVRNELGVCFGQFSPVYHGRDHAAVIVSGNTEDGQFSLHGTLLCSSIQAWRLALGNSPAVPS